MRRLLVLLCALALGFAAPAAAQNVIQRLVSPGPLAQAHAQAEARCENCHAAFNRTGQNQLCVACHRTVGADIAAHTGFHGRARNPQAACSSCHDDHHGRAFAMVRFDPRTFSHEQSDYPLRGAHARVACASCHVAGRKYREASNQCSECHRDDDPHRGRLGARCSSCHTEETWHTVRFDHSTTDFPLVGGHLRARCSSCHAQERYQGTPTGCIDCHRADDTHHGSLGTECASCHTALGWTSLRFNHDRTQFPLRGAHATTQCQACHTRPAGQVRLPTDCLSCHREDDAHHGANGTACADCHNVINWHQTSFNHDRTSFPLHGGHTRVGCSQCHTQPAGRVRLGTTCISCHRDDDPHRGQEGEDCAQCHNDVGWRDHVRFDHGLTRFPLVGSHAQVACASCHTTSRFREVSDTCRGCHADDDRHQGKLGPNCGLCHDPSSWAHWTYDHDAQTHFPLTGAHAGLQCEGCHTTPTTNRVRQASACIACHRRDDTHHGDNGPECGRCHTTESFRIRRSGL